MIGLQQWLLPVSAMVAVVVVVVRDHPLEEQVEEEDGMSMIKKERMMLQEQP